MNKTNQIIQQVSQQQGGYTGQQPGGYQQNYPPQQGSQGQPAQQSGQGYQGGQGQAYTQQQQQSQSPVVKDKQFEDVQKHQVMNEEQKIGMNTSCYLCYLLLTLHFLLHTIYKIYCFI